MHRSRLNVLRRLTIVALCSIPLAAQPPRSTLHIITQDGSIAWWRSDRAPEQWRAPVPEVASAFRWAAVRPGIDTASAELHVNRGLLRLRIVAVRLDPALLDLRLVQRTAKNGMTGAWSLGDAGEAVFAVNAGQFAETGPWGWIVRDGLELGYPGRGPLAMAIAVDSGGVVHWLDDRALPAARRSAAYRTAFQSYPVLLDSAGVVPGAIRTGRDMDIAHRDTRLIVARTDDGRILFLLTRFVGAGRILERLPAGLTIPESAALAGALGARPALMLDGGLSAQMMVRAPDRTLSWPGSRRVPLGLVAYERH